MIYLDTSAFLKLYLLEAGSQEVQAHVSSQDEPLPVWDILEAEFTNALYLKVFWREITREQAKEQIARFAERKRRGLYHTPDVDRTQLMTVFSRLREETPRLGCRSLDILHVACACLLQAKAFLTFDARQRSLAEHAGLPVP